MRDNRVFGLDVLRAAAISMVVVSHCTYILFEESVHPIILAIRSIGAIGVDLFFVLSGYLIGGILLKQIEKGRLRFGDFLLFWKRRWFRTLPNYFLAFAINVLIVLGLNESLPKHWMIYIPFLQNFVTPHPDFFTEAWSLSIEEYSYLILPILLYLYFIIFGRNAQRKNGFLWVTIGLILFQFLIRAEFYSESQILSYKDWSASFRKVVIYRLDAITYGFVLVYFYRKFPDFFKQYKKALFALSILAFLSTHLWIYFYQVLPQSHLAFYIFVYLPLIAICCGLTFPLILTFNARKPFVKIIYFLSTRSYAIYLLNYSIVLLSLQHFFDLSTKTFVFKLLVVIVFLVLTLGLSNLLYRYFEKPILDYRDKKYSFKTK